MTETTASCGVQGLGGQQQPPLLGASCTKKNSFDSDEDLLRPDVVQVKAATTTTTAPNPGLITNSILFHRLLTINDHCKKSGYSDRCTIKVCVRSFQPCPGPSAPSSTHLTVSLFLCSPGSSVWGEGDGPWRLADLSAAQQSLSNWLGGTNENIIFLINESLIYPLNKSKVVFIY